MSFSPAEAAACERLACLALEEDLGATGDLTSLALIPADRIGAAVFVVRPPGSSLGCRPPLPFAARRPALSFESAPG